MKRQYQAGLRHKQQGAVLVLVTIAMIALIAMAGLALDGGHLLLNKTRLQNAVDAAALSGARTLADYSKGAPGAESAARAAALATFLNNLGLAENKTLNDAYSADGAFTVEFSDTLNPFNSGSLNPGYIRVIAADLSLASWLVKVMGIDDLPVSASAVAGTIKLDSNIDNVLPILACGCNSIDGSCLDGDTDGDGIDDHHLGYPFVEGKDEELESLQDLTVLKLASGTESDVGPGNFRLLRLEDDEGNEITGGNEIRYALAGSATYEIDIGEETTGTEPGNKIGPVFDGLNTRFGDIPQNLKDSGAVGDPVPETRCDSSCDAGVYTLEEINPPPLIVNADGDIKRQDVTEADQVDDLVDYATYLSTYDGIDCNSNVSGCWRRVVALPIGECSGTTSGASENVSIYGVGCFFLT
jgi:Flp pilus assembly protein TadG